MREKREKGEKNEVVAWMEENRLKGRSCHESVRACMTHLLKYNQLNPPSSHFSPFHSRPSCSVAKSKREMRGKE